MQFRTGVAAAGLAGLILLVAPVAPAAASGGGGCGGPVTNESGVRVSIEQYCFVPTVLYADVGDTVTFENVDSFPHTVAGANLAWGSFESLRRNRSVNYTFSSPGVFAYVCTLHPGMVGTVVVGDPGPGGVLDRNSVRRVRALAASQSEPLSSGGASNDGALWLAMAVGVGAVAVVIGRRLRRSHK